LGLLLAGDDNFLGINDDNEVAGIEVGGLDGFVFSAHVVGDLCRQPAQDRAFGVNHVPLALVQIYFGQMCFHLKS
jgi:hypothetical protein